MWRRLHDLLEEHLRASPWRRHVEASRVIQVFRTIVRQAFPGTITESVQAVKLDGGVLTVHVPHPTIAHAVLQKKQQLLESLRRQGVVIENIHILIRPTHPGQSQ